MLSSGKQAIWIIVGSDNFYKIMEGEALRTGAKSTMEIDAAQREEFCHVSRANTPSFAHYAR